jgi:N-acetylmuramoyl-L-alanine amidase
MKPIIDTGHGGMIDGVYQDLASLKNPPDPKQYTFTQHNITLYEGVINRNFGKRLEQKLDQKDLFSLTTHIQKDTPLTERINIANNIVSQFPNEYFLMSIHCDKLTKSIEGLGNKAKGGHIIIAPGIVNNKTNLYYKDSRKLAEHFSKVLGFKRSISERIDISMVKSVNCPSILIECGFYDNYEEGMFLNSEKGIEHFGSKLAEAVKTFKL